MPLFRSLLAGVLLVTVGTAYAQESKTPAKKAVPKIRPDQAPGYEPTVIEGFTVLFSKEAWRHRDDSKYEISPLKVLESEIKMIVGRMPVKSVNILRNLPIWVEWDDRIPGGNGRLGGAVAVYYGGSQLRMLQRGMPPLKAHTVTILRLKSLTEEHQPKVDSGRCVILHEIAHAVHHQLLGWENQVVMNAYKQAMERKLYDAEAYAATDEAEFFAEASCAYFNQLDYFPRTRTELQKHDPVTFKVMEEVWGKTKIAMPKKATAKLGERVEAPPLEKLQWGKHVVGPRATASTAQGKPTIFLYWNGDSVSSLSALSKMAVWDAELRDFGLVSAAVHLTRKYIFDFKAIAEERQVAYAVNMDFWDEDSLVEELKDFPLCLVYKADGTCIFRGSPFDAEPSVRLAVGEAIVAAADVDTPPKQLEPLVDALRKGKAPSTIYARLSPMTKSKDLDLAAAAKSLLAKLTEAGQKVLTETEPKLKEEPVDSFLALERVAVAYKDTPVGARAAEHVNRLKQTKAVALELKARPSLAIIKKMETELSGKPGAVNPKDPIFRYENALQLRQLNLAVIQMETAHPTARASEQARKIAKRFGFD